jgi:hypothetical protein
MPLDNSKFLYESLKKVATVNWDKLLEQKRLESAHLIISNKESQ